MKPAQQYRLSRSARRYQRQMDETESWFAARMGDGNGNIKVPDMPTLRYVRPWGSDLPIVVGRGGAPDMQNYPVRVGKSKSDKRLRILGTLDYDGIVYPPGSEGVLAHAPTHRWGNGTDVAWIVAYQITDLGVYASGGLTVTVYPGQMMVNGLPVDVAQENIDLSAKVPVSGALYVLIYLDGTGDILTLDGTNKNLLDLQKGDIPATPAGCVALAGVRIYAGQTVISSDPASMDIVDMRWSSMMHTHTSSTFVNQIVHYDYSASEYLYYAPSNAGLTSALAAAAANDLITLPGGYFTGDFVVPDNVAVVGASMLGTTILGTITLGELAQIQQMTVWKVASSAGAIFGVKGAVADLSQIQECIIKVNNTGAGAAYGVQFAGYCMDIRDTYIRAEASAGNARCLYSSGAPTGVTNVHNTIFANTGDLSAAPAANWKVAEGVVPYCYACTWHQGYAIGTEVEYRDGDRARSFVVQDIDGTPAVGHLSAVKFTNGYVTDNSDGTVSVDVGHRVVGLQSPYTQTVVVDIGGKGDYTSIKAACDYVATQTRAAQDEWVIFVRPGFYNESPFTIPTYTYVIGDTGVPAGSSGYGWSAYVYTTTMTTGAFITLTAGSSIQNMYVYVAVGTATGDTQCVNAGNTGARVINCRFAQVITTVGAFVHTILYGAFHAALSYFNPKSSATCVAINMAGSNASTVAYCTLFPGALATGIINSGGANTAMFTRFGDAAGTFFATDINVTGGSLSVNNTPYKTVSGTITHIDRWFPASAAIREAPAATDTPLILKGATGQTADIAQDKDSAAAIHNKRALPGAASATETTFNNQGSPYLDFCVKADNYDAVKVDASDDAVALMSNPLGKIGVMGATPVVRQAALTTQLTTITHTAPGTPDYAVQDLVDTGGFGFVTKDEGNTVLSTIANLQARVAELEARLKSYGWLP